jgi:hypothetical protein
MKLLEAHGLADRRACASILHGHLLTVEEDMRMHAIDDTNGGSYGAVRGHVDFGGVNASPSPRTTSSPPFHGRTTGPPPPPFLDLTKGTHSPHFRVGGSTGSYTDTDMSVAVSATHSLPIPPTRQGDAPYRKRSASNERDRSNSIGRKRVNSVGASSTGGGPF